jgi:hypothetical protein
MENSIYGGPQCARFFYLWQLLLKRKTRLDEIQAGENESREGDSLRWSVVWMKRVLSMVLAAIVSPAVLPK